MNRIGLEWAEFCKINVSLLVSFCTSGTGILIHLQVQNLFIHIFTHGIIVVARNHRFSGVERRHLAVKLCTIYDIGIHDTTYIRRHILGENASWYCTIIKVLWKIRHRDCELSMCIIQPVLSRRIIMNLNILPHLCELVDIAP